MAGWSYKTESQQCSGGNIIESCDPVGIGCSCLQHGSGAIAQGYCHIGQTGFAGILNTIGILIIPYECGNGTGHQVACGQVAHYAGCRERGCSAGTGTDIGIDGIIRSLILLGIGMTRNTIEAQNPAAARGDTEKRHITIVTCHSLTDLTSSTVSLHCNGSFNTCTAVILNTITILVIPCACEDGCLAVVGIIGRIFVHRIGDIVAVGIIESSCTGCAPVVVHNTRATTGSNEANLDFPRLAVQHR